MAYSLKNMWAAMAVTLVAATSVNAAPFFDQTYGDTSGCCPCGPVRPCVDPCGNWFVDAEFIYWNVSEPGLEYGTESATTVVDGVDVASGKAKHVGDKWEPGFRIGLGYDLPCDGWDVVAYWTNLYSRRSNSHTTAAGSTFTLAHGDARASALADFTHAKWRLNLNVLDVELGREFCVSQAVTIRPYLGVRAAWIDQKFDIGSFAGDTFVQQTNLKSKFSGAGLVGGLDSEWKLGWWGLSVYGEAGASILYGSFKNSYSNDFVTTDVSDLLSYTDNYNGATAIGDAAIGLRWREYFCCDTVALTLQLGYEAHYFWDQNRFPAYFDDSVYTHNRGDLSTNGITVAAKVAF